MPSPAA